MITKDFNHKLHIPEVNYQGDICFNELIASGNEIQQDQTLSGKLRILTDVTRGKYNLSTTEFP